jgi:hypothetical protein
MAASRRATFLTSQVSSTAGANACFDYAIPNLIVSFANTTNFTQYSTASFRATNGAVLLAMVATSIAASPVAPTTMSWNSHTWIKIADTNYNTKAAPTHNLSVWRTLVNNNNADTLTAGFGAATQTGCGMAVFQILNADNTEAFGSNAVIQVAQTAYDATVNPSISYSTPAKCGTNMLVIFQGDNIAGTTGRTPNSSNQWQTISQTAYAAPNSGHGVYFSEAAIGGPVTATNYCTSRDSALVLIEVQPKALNCGTNFADALVDGAGTNVVGTVLTRFAITNGTKGKFEQYDLFFSKNVQGETATNWFFSTLVNPLKRATRVGNYGSSNVIIQTSNPSLGLSLRASNSFTYAVLGRASPANQVILNTRGFVYLGATNDSNLGQVLYDLVRSDGNVTGDFVVFQLDTGTFAGGQSNRVNIETNPGGATTHSAYIAVKTNSWFYWQLQDNRLTGLARLAIWDVRTDPWTLLGDVTSPQSHIGTFAEGARDTDISPLKFGNAESGVSTNNIVFENIEVDDSTGRFNTNWVYSASTGP